MVGILAVPGRPRYPICQNPIGLEDDEYDQESMHDLEPAW
jgi:hypothetical protein